MKKQIVISCGGTGGHIYPALAIGRSLLSHGLSIRFIGSNNRMEKDKIPAEGFDFFGLPIYPLEKKHPLRSLRNLWHCIQLARQNLRCDPPAVVLGLGSYITVPTVIAAWQEKIPIVLLETNVVPGKANLYLAKMAQVVAIAHEETRHYFPQNIPIRLTGSPVRPEIIQGNRAEGLRIFDLSADCLTLTLIGGSQGAQCLNEALLKILPELLALENLQIIHICGERHASQIKKAAGQYASHPRYRLLNYVDNMPDLLACTDLAISRAGASMIAELLACQIPSILIPGSFGGGHQQDNARALAQAGAAILLPEVKLNEKLATTIRDVIMDTEKLAKMRENCRHLNSPHAAEKVAQMILEMIAQPKEEAFSC